MAERISRKPDELAQQCDRAYRLSADFREITGHAIQAEPNWPPTAPIAMTLLTRSQNLTTQVISGKSPATQLSVINSLESQLREARQAIKPFIEDAREDMTKVDQATHHSEMKHSRARYCADALHKHHSHGYKRHSRESGNPVRIVWRSGNVLDSRFRGNDASPALFHKPSGGGLEQVVIHATKDGTPPASIWVDWEAVEGAVYEIQWFTDAPLTQMLGSATVTATQATSEVAGQRTRGPRTRTRQTILVPSPGRLSQPTRPLVRPSHTRSEYLSTRSAPPRAATALPPAKIGRRVCIPTGTVGTRREWPGNNRRI